MLLQNKLFNTHTIECKSFDFGCMTDEAGDQQGYLQGCNVPAVASHRRQLPAAAYMHLFLSLQAFSRV